MHPDIAKYLEDIRLSIEIIAHHVSDVSSLEDYQLEITKIDAVERRLAIIGEALFKADKLDKRLQISDKTKIIALRHILVHEYDLIEDSTIWNIIHKNLPLLKQEVNNLL
ncbi:HepT-like ribonuclease domain-containing protein [Taibaiella soli]|uniref:DUF86 domain-containing protein n=1 Tax=Taibaiella soli TaxID=1649169 RepID=A0A2W2B212_9BACT|nr:HepT-like ribonuclease domain-containing protein [Taibaiella soli]PZF74304.1 hypothetical protein DN068_04665 [Taibaiella soli]